MSSHAQTIEAIYKFLPRRYMRFAWVHASNSCRKASTSNMFGRDIDAAADVHPRHQFESVHGRAWQAAVFAV